MESLGDCLSDFEVCARRAVESIVGSPTLMCRRFSTRLGAEEIPALCTIRSGNGTFDVHLSMGLRSEEVAPFLGRIASSRRRLDMLGEVLNTLAGNFLGRDTFIAKCGEIAPSLPFFGESDTIKGGSRVIEGVMQINSVHVRFTLTVCESAGEGQRE